VTIEWTFDMAKAAGLTGKDIWKQYPRAMLRARVVSEGIRTVYPAVLCGMYAPEEVRDMVDVEGTAEVSAPDYPQQAEPTESQYDFEAAEATINGFDDDGLLAQWLAQERIKNGWKRAEHPHYVAVKSVCAERAAVIRDARKSAEQSKASE
jgi:hypothetical protein